MSKISIFDHSFEPRLVWFSEFILAHYIQPIKTARLIKQIKMTPPILPIKMARPSWPIILKTHLNDGNINLLSDIFEL